MPLTKPKPNFDDHNQRIVALEERVDLIHVEINGVKTVTNKMATETSEILEVLKYTKSVGGFVAKHGPRVIAFCVGSLVAGGYVSPVVSKLFLQIFGL